jgi:hypothetical protein
MRVVSDHPVKMRDGSVGYIHNTGEATFAPIHERKEHPKPEVDWKKLWVELRQENKLEWLEGLSRQLGVSYSSLVALDALWSRRHQAWAFPMKNGFGDIVGVRLRFKDGSKRSIFGSRNALFLPEPVWEHKRLYVLEGPTDTASALTIGLNSVGRPSCSAGVFDIVTLCSRIHPTEVVVIANNDPDRTDKGLPHNVGVVGAEVLAGYLPVRHCIITVPCKDTRRFIQEGGTAHMLESMVSSMVWCLPAYPQCRTPATSGTNPSGL